MEQIRSWKIEGESEAWREGGRKNGGEFAREHRVREGSLSGT